MNKLIKKVTDLLVKHDIAHEIMGNVIHTKRCTVEVWGREVTVNENPVELTELITEIQKNN